MHFDECADFEPLTPAQESIVAAYFPEESVSIEMTLDDSGGLTGGLISTPLKQDSEKLDKRVFLIEFLLHPEDFEPTDFAMEVVYRRCVPGAVRKTVWGDENESLYSQDIDPTKIRNIFVTMSAGDPPSIDVHAEVLMNAENEDWEPVCTHNQHTDVTSWVQRKIDIISAPQPMRDEVLRGKEDVAASVTRIPGMRNIIRPPSS